jgi:hypothetical protein
MLQHFAKWWQKIVDEINVPKKCWNTFEKCWLKNVGNTSEKSWREKMLATIPKNVNEKKCW